MIRHAERDFQNLGGLSDGQFFADPFVASGNPDAAVDEATNRMRAG
jgi:CDP-4-dehydro-6-deoxyglucose reductase/3-phenylpropionate/trans-cinnamate dioxygenase ferredoxin reductase subunit